MTHISYNHNSLDPFPEVAFAPDLQGDVYRLRITQEDTHIMRAHPLSVTARTLSDEVIEFAETIEQWNVGNET